MGTQIAIFTTVVAALLVVRRFMLKYAESDVDIENSVKTHINDSKKGLKKLKELSKKKKKAKEI